MSGFDVLSAIKAIRQSRMYRSFILSNLGQEKDIEKTKQLGAVSTSSRPSTILMNIIAEYSRDHQKQEKQRSDQVSIKTGSRRPRLKDTHRSRIGRKPGRGR